MGRRKRGWNAAAGLSLDVLRQMLNSKVADLASRRDELASELADVEDQLAAAGGAGMPRRRGPGRPPKRGPGRPPKMGRGPGRPKGSGKGRRGRKPGPKGQSELHNAIRGALKSSSDAMKLDQI